MCIHVELVSIITDLIKFYEARHEACSYLNILNVMQHGSSFKNQSQNLKQKDVAL